MYLDKSSTASAKTNATERLQISTVRSFEGGLNVTDTDLNMSPKYAKVLDNLERSTDGSLTLRPGTKLLTNKITDTSEIINTIYFNGLVWAVQASGNITTTDGAGNVTVKTIPAPGWAAGITFVDFTIFNSDLIITNGKDKPLIVSGDPTGSDGLPNPLFNNIDFLGDPAVHNVNTPVAKYVIAHGRFVVFAGSPVEPSTIFISEEDSAFTYFGDDVPAATNAINIDLGPRVSLGSSIITGMVAYRDKLLITFERGVLPLNLGVFTKDTPPVHDPTDDGFIEEFGCLSHRSLVSVGDDTFFCDNVGVNSITRVNVFNTLRPVRASHLIDPLITALIQPLTTAQIQSFVFAIYDLRNFRYMLFIPIMAPNGTVTETVGFSYTNIPTLKINAWARLRGWVWRSACRTSLQNIIFSRGNKLYAYDFDGTQNGDRFGDPTVLGGAGEPVPFIWELPWADFKHRMDIKYTRYVSLDTTGSAAFTMETFVDNFIDQPAYTTVPFIAGSGKGYGTNGYGTAPYGDGGDRRAIEERLFAITAKFKLMKLRFSGSTKNKLRFISVSIAYLNGSIRR